MRKVIIAVSMLATTLIANAQEPVAVAVEPAPISTVKMYKPVAGDVLAEIGLFSTGIVDLPTSAFGTPQLKFRYFLQDQLALRVGFNLTQKSTTTKIYEVGGSGEGSVKEMNSILGINAGIEKHFAGTGRLSTYVGADGSVQFTGASYKYDNTNDGINYTNGDSRKVRGTNTNGNSSFGIGVRLVTGADYYFVDKVYLGAEFGWGFIASKDGKTKTESTTAGVSNPTVETKSGGGTFELAPSLTAGVRIGFRF